MIFQYLYEVSVQFIVLTYTKFYEILGIYPFKVNFTVPAQASYNFLLHVLNKTSCLFIQDLKTLPNIDLL